MNDDPEIEDSPLSKIVTRNGISVELKIYRLAGGEDGWSLEVVTSDGASIVWDDLFRSDVEAYAAFQYTIESEGIATFAEPAPTRH